VEHPEATGADEAKARRAYREFAAGQNRLWYHYGDRKFGLDDAEYAAALAQAAEPEAQRLAVEPEPEAGSESLASVAGIGDQAVPV
jgi:hypothetical protein